MSRHRQKPIYGNCLIVAPDGQPLCRTNQERLDWYLDRNLADIVEGDCPTIRLKFEPSGRKGADDPYCTSVKENRCVCCGTAELITRHHVVPYCFRKHFPSEMKDHCLHDVVPLCVSCHERYEDAAMWFKQCLARESDIPVHGKGIVVNKAAYDVRSAANALSQHGDKIPEPRKNALLARLQGHFGRQTITEEDIIAATKLSPMVHGPDFMPFGKYIVEHLPDIQDFIVRWRKHFIDVMNPQYMPSYWSIHHRL